LKLPFRKSVIAVIQNEKKEVLVGQRSNDPQAWQFPQGGIEDGETLEEALYRELAEEIGSAEVNILKQAPKETSYLFPPEMESTIKLRFCGQLQTWFLVQFKPGATFDLSKSEHEFSALKWVTIKHIVEHIVDWKKESYKQGLTALGIWR
jgi:putative (di)nucleoside polyphosphate hydrolase